MSQSNTPLPNSLESRIIDLQKIAELGITPEQLNAYERFQTINGTISAKWQTFYITLGLLILGAILTTAIVIFFILNPTGWAFGSTGFVVTLTGFFFRGFFHIIRHHFPSEPPKNILSS